MKPKTDAVSGFFADFMTGECPCTLKKLNFYMKAE